VKVETYALDAGASYPLDEPPRPVFARSYAPANVEAHLPALVSDGDVVVHRVVAVPPSWHAVTVFDQAAGEQILAVAGTAPLHDALALRLREAIAVAAPHSLQLAVADGAFHRTLQPAAFTYAIPRAWTRFGLRRRGYHGLSHEYAAHRGARLIGRDVRDLRVATLHLGGGSSLCAVQDGLSIDTTMGFTPLDGVPMATRSGAVDPGILLAVLRGGTTPASLERILERESGLLGISGRSGDVRVLQAAAPTDADARLALDVLAWRVRTALGAIVAALGRVDLVVFTGGIGEHVAAVREAAIAGLEGHGVRLDSASNRDEAGEGRLDAPGSTAAVAIVTARENWQLARAGLGFAASRDGVVQEPVDLLERA
jgi:acetate kinase